MTIPKGHSQGGHYKEKKERMKRVNRISKKRGFMDCFPSVELTASLGPIMDTTGCERSVTYFVRYRHNRMEGYSAQRNEVTGTTGCEKWY